jgi:hypothetical protein
VVYGQRGVDEMMHMLIGMTEIPQEYFEAMVAEREQLLRARPNTVASTK